VRIDTGRSLPVAASLLAVILSGRLETTEEGYAFMATSEGVNRAVNNTFQNGF